MVFRDPVVAKLMNLEFDHELLQLLDNEKEFLARRAIWEDEKDLFIIHATSV